MARFSSALAAAVLFVVCLWIQSAHAQGVVELTDDNFDAQVGKGEWLLEFYAPWCGYCRRFGPVYDEVAGELFQSNPSIRVGKVDVDKNGITTTRFLISRLPTIYHIKDKVIREVKVGFEKDTLVEYVKSKEWQSTEPWSSWWSPFSLVGSALAIAGWIPKRLAALAQYLNQYMPMWAVYVLGGGFFFGLLLFVAFMIPIQPAPAQQAEYSGVPQQDREARQNASRKSSSAAGDGDVEEDEDGKPLASSGRKSGAASRRRRHD